MDRKFAIVKARSGRILDINFTNRAKPLGEARYSHATLELYGESQSKPNSIRMHLSGTSARMQDGRVIGNNTGGGTYYSQAKFILEMIEEGVRDIALNYFPTISSQFNFEKFGLEMITRTFVQIHSSREDAYKQVNDAYAICSAPRSSRMLITGVKNPAHRLGAVVEISGEALITKPQ